MYMKHEALWLCSINLEGEIFEWSEAIPASLGKQIIWILWPRTEIVITRQTTSKQHSTQSVDVYIYNPVANDVKLIVTFLFLITIRPFKCVESIYNWIKHGFFHRTNKCLYGQRDDLWQFIHISLWRLCPEIPSPYAKKHVLDNLRRFVLNHASQNEKQYFKEL